MGTDADWDKWGEIDPYFGVLSADKFRAENLDDESRAAFFHTGQAHIDSTMAIVREHLDADFRPTASLDFGCGVGRLVMPLARISERVVGVDVSDNMLAESAANCRNHQIENVSFVKSDDGLTNLEGEFNLIHSCLVLQHIPTNKGMRLLEELLQHLEPGGVVAIQIYYRCVAPKLVRALVKLRYKLPIMNALRNLLRGRPLREPAMQLHTYDIETVITLFRSAGVEGIYLRPYEMPDFQCVALYAQKSR